MARFSSRPELRNKGFEMVAVLCEAFSPTGNLATFHNFSKFLEMEKEHDEPLPTYMACIRTLVSLLNKDNIAVHPVLLNLFYLKGLPDDYELTKQDFAVRGNQFATLSIRKIEEKCQTFDTATRNMDRGGTIMAQAAKTSTTPAPPVSKAPTKPATSRGKGTPYPPSKPPWGKHTTAVTKEAVTACPLCHKTPYFTKCGYGLRAGYVIARDPTTAAKRLT